VSGQPSVTLCLAALRSLIEENESLAKAMHVNDASVEGDTST
jgi:hypothetical protein